MARNSPALGPYSRRFRHGLVADICDGRSTTGRFARVLERELTNHCGGSAAISVTQRLLISRIVRLQLQADQLDTKLASAPESWTDHDSRTLGAINSALRLGLRELGYKASEPSPPTLADIIAQTTATRGAAA